MTVNSAVTGELGRLRVRVPELTGSVLATADGLVVAHDGNGIEPDSVAALAAAHLGLARRFAQAVNHGELREAVVECDLGYITSYAAGPNALLTLITTGDANLARVHLEARRCVRRLAALLTVEPPRIRPGVPAPTIPTGPQAPLVRRTPMATLPGNVRRPAP
jgi:predicted regulator of Ras-like GTPase activity (Roadblock/LC7/MglB family)